MLTAVNVHRKRERPVRRQFERITSSVKLPKRSSSLCPTPMFTAFCAQTVVFSGLGAALAGAAHISAATTTASATKSLIATSLDAEATMGTRALALSGFVTYDAGE